MTDAAAPDPGRPLARWLDDVAARPAGAVWPALQAQVRARGLDAEDLRVATAWAFDHGIVGGVGWCLRARAARGEPEPTARLADALRRAGLRADADALAPERPDPTDLAGRVRLHGVDATWDASTPADRVRLALWLGRPDDAPLYALPDATRPVWTAVVAEQRGDDAPILAIALPPDAPGEAWLARARALRRGGRTEDAREALARVPRDALGRAAPAVPLLDLAMRLDGCTGWFDRGIDPREVRDDLDLAAALGAVVPPGRLRGRRAAALRAALDDVLFGLHANPGHAPAMRRGSAWHIPPVPVDPRAASGALLGALDLLTLSEAIDAFGRIDVDPDHPLSRTYRAEARLWAGDPAAAKADCAHAIATWPGTRWAYSGLALARLQQGDPHGAHRVLRRARRRLPPLAAALVYEGEVALATGRTREALDRLTACTVRFPWRTAGWLLLSTAHRRAGDARAADAALARAWETAPAFADDVRRAPAAAQQPAATALAMLRGNRSSRTLTWRSPEGVDRYAALGHTAARAEPPSRR